MCLMWHHGAVADGAPVLDVLRGLGTGNGRLELRRRDFDRMWALRGEVTCPVGRGILNRWRRHRVQGVFREKVFSPETGVGLQPLLDMTRLLSRVPSGLKKTSNLLNYDLVRNEASVRKFVVYLQQQ